MKENQKIKIISAGVHHVMPIKDMIYKYIHPFIQECYLFLLFVVCDYSRISVQWLPDQ